MAKAPLALVKDRFGTKEKLVEQLAGQVEPLEGESREDLKTRLAGASNRKLLKLLEVEEKVQELFGSKDKLVDAVLQLARPGAKKVDEDYRAALAARSKAQLLAMHAALSRRASREKKRATGAPAAKKASAKRRA